VEEFWKIGRGSESGEVIDAWKIKEEWTILVHKGKVRAKPCEGELYECVWTEDYQVRGADLTCFACV